MKKFTFVIILFSLSLFSCMTVNGDENTGTENPIVEKTIKITGMVQIYGNEPFTFAGIEDENGIQYAVYPSTMKNELSRLQGYLIEFTVVMLDESYDQIGFNGGSVSVVHWELL